MPNYCINKLVLKGKDDEIKKLQEYLMTQESDFDFNRVIEMPESIKSTSRGSAASLALAVCIYLKERKVTEHLKLLHVKYGKNLSVEDYVNNLVVAEEVDITLGEKLMYNKKKYGQTDWYDWSLANWQTKWNSISVVWKGNNCEFLTAWNPPLPIIDNMAKIYPSIDFEFCYLEPGVGLAGREVYKNANNIISEQYKADDDEYMNLMKGFGYD